MKAKMKRIIFAAKNEILNDFNNELFGFKTPKFIKFNEFRNKLRGVKLD